MESDGDTHRNDFRMPDLERKKMWDDLQLEVTKLMVHGGLSAPAG
jgi:hypothetical protein